MVKMFCAPGLFSGQNVCFRNLLKIEKKVMKCGVVLRLISSHSCLSNTAVAICVCCLLTHFVYKQTYNATRHSYILC